MQNLDELKIELNTSILVDQRRYNAPAMEQVDAIWQDGSEERNKFKRSIMVYPNFGHCTGVPWLLRSVSLPYLVSRW